MTDKKREGLPKIQERWKMTNEKQEGVSLKNFIILIVLAIICGIILGVVVSLCMFLGR